MMGGCWGNLFLFLVLLHSYLDLTEGWEGQGCHFGILGNRMLKLCVWDVLQSTNQALNRLSGLRVPENALCQPVVYRGLKLRPGEVPGLQACKQLQNCFVKNRNRESSLELSVMVL